MPQAAKKQPVHEPAPAPNEPPLRKVGAALDPATDVDDVATKAVPDPEGEPDAVVRDLTFHLQREPIMVHDYTGTDIYTGTSNAWVTWNTDVTNSATTSQVYRIWVNGTNATGDICDVGWADATGECRARKRAGLWKLWNNAATTGNTITTDTWDTWNVHFRRGPAQVVPIGAPAVHTRRRTETPEERQRREEAEAKRLLERQEREAERKAINGRAEQLLMSLMTEQQRKDWIASGQFFLIKEDRKYRIKRGSHGNVELVDEKNQVLESFCALPRGHGGELPVADTVAGQLLALKFDEEEFVKTANSTMRKDGHKRLKDRIREHGHLRLAA